MTLIHAVTHGSVLRRGFVVLGVVAVSSVNGWSRRPVAEAEPARQAGYPQQDVEAVRGDLTLLRIQLARAEEIMDYSSRYAITADLAAAIYDIAVAEGVEPALAFSLVRVESNFDPRAKSVAGAIGYTQILPSTARLYEPGLTIRQLYERHTNLRLGFRYLRDLLERYQGSPSAARLALLSYNRGPARVEELLDAGQDPQNGYSTAVFKGARRKS